MDPGLKRHVKETVNRYLSGEKNADIVFIDGQARDAGSFRGQSSRRSRLPLRCRV